MLKKRAAIGLISSIVFAPIVLAPKAAMAQMLADLRQHASAQLKKAGLKVVGAQTSSANVAKAAEIETSGLPKQEPVAWRLEEAAFMKAKAPAKPKE